MRLWADQASTEARRSLCVATLNGNGYVREAAIQALASQRHPDFIPFLLWSLKDWVSQVRVAAVKSVRQLLEPDMAPAFLKQYRLITQLGLVNRIDLADVVDELNAFLRHPECSNHIFAAMESDDARLRMFSYRLLSHTLGDNDELQRRVAGDREPAARAWFASQLVRLGADQRLMWLERMIADRSTYVACRVIRSLDSDLRELFRTHLVVAACSPSKPVREAARYAVDDWGRHEFANLYRNKLTGTDETTAELGILGGLGETGTTQDAELLKTYMTSQRSRIRFEAVRAVAQLDREVASDILISSLADTSSRVRYLAVKVLSEKPCDAETDRIYSILFQANHETSVRAALRVMTRQGSWEAVPSMLFAAVHKSEDVRLEALEQGRAWISKYGSSGWLKPSAKVCPYLQRALAAYKDHETTTPQQYQASWGELVKWVDSVCS